MGGGESLEKLTINGQDRTHLVILDGALLFDSWGTLLNYLEKKHIQAGHCITSVMIDGEEPKDYRRFFFGHQLLKHINEIAITTADFDTVVRESLTELQEELKKSIVSVGEIIKLLENHLEEEAYEKLAQFLDSIKIFADVFGKDLGWAEIPDGEETSAADIAAALERALSQLIAAQENRYWVSICDVLEYEIVPVLEAWHLIVTRTLASLQPAPPPVTPTT